MTGATSLVSWCRYKIFDITAHDAATIARSPGSGRHLPSSWPKRCLDRPSPFFLKCDGLFTGSGLGAGVSFGSSFTGSSADFSAAGASFVLHPAILKCLSFFTNNGNDAVNRAAFPASTPMYSSTPLCHSFPVPWWLYQFPLQPAHRHFLPYHPPSYATPQIHLRSWYRSYGHSDHFCHLISSLLNCEITDLCGICQHRISLSESTSPQ